MSTNQKIFFVILSGIAAYFLTSYRAENRSTPNEEPVIPSPTPVTLQVPSPIENKKFQPNINVKAISAPQLSTQKIEENKKPNGPPTTVDFKIEDGLAVAFGDVVLGAPLNENIAKHGIAKPAPVKLWESGVIPFHIQPTMPNPERILQALDYFKNTPINFIPYSDQPDAIVFQPGPGHCKSYLGKVGGLQPIWLSGQCFAPEIAHEIMHALGFIHEHSRTDRGQYVEIVWENIDDQYKSQFTMAPESLMLPLKSTSFDYQSIMIYEPDAFARQPGLTTLRTKGNSPLYPLKTLSKQDVERLFKVYAR
ncbi:MAG: M12 family metallopeptidase [Oligoflexia bacterium]|nr:M12 family metallopeptidase [Oligoflexia bacterium]